MAAAGSESTPGEHHPVAAARGGVLVRPFRADDIAAVVKLNESVFPDNPLSAQGQAERFRAVCVANPWHHLSPSLVAEDARGRIVGFLGVVPRAMSLGGRPIAMAVSQHLMVEPDSRASLAAIHLLKTFLAGPQDLSMADWANETSRRIWERLGGSTSLPYSLHWRRPLRPVGFVASILKGRRSTRFLGTCMRPLAMADGVLCRIPAAGLALPDPTLYEEPLDVATLQCCIQQFSARRALAPVYDAQSLGWVVQMLEGHTGLGALQRVVIRDASRDIVGWFIYFLTPGGNSRVFQIGATDASIGKVLDRLFQHAWRGGAVEISGRIEPRSMRAFSSRYCLFTPGLGWLLVHSRIPEAIHSLDRGDAFLSRLEGDMWLL